jgi:hypothetical protein
MTISTPVKNTESIALGLAKLYIYDSSTNISTTTLLETETAYLGAKTSVSFEVTKEFVKRFKKRNNILMLFQEEIKKAGLSLSITLIELTEKNLSYAFGGSGTTTNLLNDLFSENELRAELVFTYPNKTNKLCFIFPKVQVTTPSISGVFNPEDALGIPMLFSVLMTENANWTTNPYGKVIFV